jgi:5'-nucleotidase
VNTKRDRWIRVARTLAVPALAVAVVALTPVAQRRDTGPAPAAWTPMTPVSVTYQQGLPAGLAAKGNLLGFNDFHGAIDKPTGSAGLINGVPAGGVEFLATWVKRLRAEAVAPPESRDSVTVAAGDLIGASPLVSAAFHDEPTMEEMNALGLEVSSVGNHEYDEGVTELNRMQVGGCHPTDGCQDGDGFAGASFRYLAANVVNKSDGLPHLPPFTVKFFDGVPVGFVGMTLKGTPGIVNPAGITTVEFKDEIATANFWGLQLHRMGVKSLVLLIHEGGAQNSPPVPLDPSSCANFAGPITPIVAGLRPEFGLVVSGHTHRFYSCALPNSSGEDSVVTSAGANGTLVTDIDFTLNRSSRRFAEISARNVIVANSDPALIDPTAKQIADKYRSAVAPIANRVVGSITTDITRDVAVTSNFESPLGDVIADAQLAYTQSAGAQIALMNPGGIRASLTFNNSPGGEAPGEITFGECFTVQPFNNLVVTQTFTGDQLKAVLEQQLFPITPTSTVRILQVSAGFTYTYTTTEPAGNRISSMKLNGVDIDPAASYQVTTNDFLANGGDGFTALTAGTNRVTAPGFDVDALVAYLGANSPVAPTPANRITRLP